MSTKDKLHILSPQKKTLNKTAGIYENNQILNDFWSFRMVGATWISGGMLFQRACTTTEKALLLAHNR